MNHPAIGIPPWLWKAPIWTLQEFSGNVKFFLSVYMIYSNNLWEIVQIVWVTLIWVQSGFPYFGELNSAFGILEREYNSQPLQGHACRKRNMTGTLHLMQSRNDACNTMEVHILPSNLIWPRGIVEDFPLKKGSVPWRWTQVTQDQVSFRGKKLPGSITNSKFISSIPI